MHQRAAGSVRKKRHTPLPVSGPAGDPAGFSAPGSPCPPDKGRRLFRPPPLCGVFARCWRQAAHKDPMHQRADGPGPAHKKAPHPRPAGGQADSSASGSSYLPAKGQQLSWFVPHMRRPCTAQRQTAHQNPMHLYAGRSRLQATWIHPSMLSLSAGQGNTVSLPWQPRPGSCVSSRRKSDRTPCTSARPQKTPLPGRVWIGAGNRETWLIYSPRSHPACPAAGCSLLTRPLPASLRAV
jgi:hypothetical protein